MQEQLTPEIVEELGKRAGYAAVEYRNEVDSTNNLAKTLPFPLPGLVVAAMQTAGRGQRGKLWVTEPGALAFSVVLPAEAAPLGYPWAVWTSQVVATVLKETVPQLCPQLTPEEITIKHPNDIYLRGKKLSGILAETTAERIVLGVGLNVNNQLLELREIATSLRVATECKYSLVAILEPIVASLLRLSKELPTAESLQSQ